MLKKRLFILLQALALVVAGTVGTAQAAVISSAEHFGTAASRDASAQLQQAVASDAVQAKLVALGVDPADAQARIDALTVEEQQMLAERMDQMPAGGILGVLGVIFVVLLVLEIVGVTNIFNKV